MELRPIDDSDVTITGTAGFEETAGSDVVVDGPMGLAALLAQLADELNAPH